MAVYTFKTKYSKLILQAETTELKFFGNFGNLVPQTYDNEKGWIGFSVYSEFEKVSGIWNLRIELLELQNICSFYFKFHLK